MAVDPLSLPFWLQRGTAFVIFAAAVFMIAAHTAIAAMVAQRTSSKTRIAVPFVVAGFLAVWLAVAVVVGDGANFPISLEARRPAQWSRRTDSVPHRRHRAVRVESHARN